MESGAGRPGDVSVSAQEYRAAAVLRASVRRFQRRSEEITRFHGLTPERYELLLAIKAETVDEGVGGPTVGRLAQILELAHSSTTQLVRRAEDRGLVARGVSARDARVRYLRLTAEGEKRLAAAVEHLRGERAELADASRQLRVDDRSS